jgi:hypothetical protein
MKKYLKIAFGGLCVAGWFATMLLVLFLVADLVSL